MSIFKRTKSSRIEEIKSGLSEDTKFDNSKELFDFLQEFPEDWKIIFSRAFSYSKPLRADFKDHVTNLVSENSYKGFLKFAKKISSFNVWYSWKKQKEFSNTDPRWIENQKKAHARKETKEKFLKSFDEARNKKNPERLEQFEHLIESINNISVLERPKMYEDFKVTCPKHGEFYTHLLRGGGHLWGEVKACPKCSHGTKTQNILYSLIELNGLKADFNLSGRNSPFIGSSIYLQEIDIYVPAKKIGFEINGAFSHNSGITLHGKRPKDKTYHAIKSIEASKLGIRLFHIWEHWDREISMSIVLAKLGIFKQKVFARTLSFSVVKHTTPEISLFFVKNHVLGEAPCTLSLFLHRGTEILQALQCVELSDEIRIVRNASKCGTTIIGGFQRLFKHLLSITNKRIVTYAIRDLTPIPEDSCYFRVGFTNLGDVGPTMSYYVHRNIYSGKIPILRRGVYNRQNFMKKKLAKFEGATIPGTSDVWHFNPEETEQQNLARLQIYPVYNSGCWKFVYSCDTGK